jgi:hypothetical protein
MESTKHLRTAAMTMSCLQRAAGVVLNEDEDPLSGLEAVRSRD